MVQLWFYQIAVKHTNRALSFVPFRMVCVQYQTERWPVVFAHGGSVISQSLCVPVAENTQKQCVTVPSALL